MDAHPLAIAGGRSLIALPVLLAILGGATIVAAVLLLQIANARDRARAGRHKRMQDRFRTRPPGDRNLERRAPG